MYALNLGFYHRVIDEKWNISMQYLVAETPDLHASNVATGQAIS